MAGKGGNTRSSKTLNPRKNDYNPKEVEDTPIESTSQRDGSSESMHQGHTLIKNAIRDVVYQMSMRIEDLCVRMNQTEQHVHGIKNEEPTSQNDVPPRHKCRRNVTFVEPSSGSSNESSGEKDEDVNLKNKRNRKGKGKKK